MNPFRKIYRWFFPPKIIIVKSGHESPQDLAFPTEFARRVGRYFSSRR